VPLTALERNTCIQISVLYCTDHRAGALITAGQDVSAGTSAAIARSVSSGNLEANCQGKVPSD